MVVRMRRNRSQTAKRRSHHALGGVHLVRCECGEPREPHRACRNCGKYRGKVAVDIVEQAKRAQRRLKRKEKELRASGQQTQQKETETAQA